MSLYSFNTITYTQTFIIFNQDNNNILTQDYKTQRRITKRC